MAQVNYLPINQQVRIKKVAERIARYGAKLPMNDDFWKKNGLSHYTYYRVIRGDINISLGFIFQFCEAFGIDVTELFRDENSSVVNESRMDCLADSIITLTKELDRKQA